MPYKIAFISLGCAKNLVNTEQMMALTRAAGHTVTGDPEGADVAVLNTCGFIESAKSEAIDHIIQLGELKKAGKLKKLLVAGCLSQRYPGDIRAELPEADGLLGTGSYTDVVRAVEALMAGERPEYFSDIHRTYEDGERLVTTPPYTAYLKIAEGCSNGCAFCIIPKLRGRYRSRSMASLLAEAEGLADRGVKELIVVAQDITRYGLDLGDGSTLAKLLTELCRLDFHWVRLHYLYPEAVTDELIQVIAREKKIVHYLDIPIQHASDEVLRRMGRRTDQEHLRRQIGILRERIPDICLRTTLISGFPGESQEDFEELYRFVNEMEFDRLGVFAYSQEEGTAAAAMPDQIEDEVKEARRDELMELQQAIAFEKAEGMIGQELEVVVEGRMTEEDVYVTRTYRDAPDVDGYLFLHTDRELMSGDFVRARVTDFNEYDLIGEMVDHREDEP